jgi:hypothetical protein
MRVYIAGPMSGLPDFNYPAFFTAEEELRGAGHQPVNPARLWNGCESPTWADYMRRGIEDVLTCEGIALLPGWGRSQGARLERKVAKALGLKVLALEHWLHPTTCPMCKAAS